MSTTIDQQRALERYARQHERHLKFLRHSPREQRWLPFVEERDMPEFKDAVIGTVALIAFVGTLIALPVLIGG
jgi:hypothetical protein